MKRRIFSVLLSSALLLTALAGCGQGGEAAPSGSSSDADSETGTRDELIFVNYRDIRDLNPHLYAGEMYDHGILYDTVVSNTEDGYVGCLAEDWTISDDGRIYTFNIRDGVTFSDGTPCDANAILANFNAILENRERHTWLEMMNLLVGVSAPDEDTFVIEMSEPYYPMLTELACIRPFAMISPNCMIDGSTMNGVNGYIGTGPYVLTDFVTDEYAVFERNENYWGEAPAIQKITVKVIPDNQTRIMALENEEIDLIFGKNMLDADAISQYVDSDRFTVSLSDPTSTRHIVLNIHGEEEQSYRDNMKAGNFDMVFNICWGMPYDPQSSLAAMRAPVYGDYAAQQGLEDKAEIDQAITDILTSTDEAERQELYDFVLTRLHEDAVYIPLTYETNKALYTSELKGVHFGTDQYDVDFASMYFE